MSSKILDLPPTSYSTISTVAIKTGAWKYVAPVYEDQLPPCSHLCPAGNDISKFLYRIAKGDVAGAAALVRAGNPLPATLGRVCPHPCESECNRKHLGGAIAIHSMERFLGDFESPALPPRAPSTGRRVAIIGAGPAGIAAAYNLALAGHAVEVFDDKSAPGGYLRTGIPDYRLPKSVLDRELALVSSTGVVFRQNLRVGRDVTFSEIHDRFDAVVLALGFHRSQPLGVPGESHSGVFNGVNLLERILLGERPALPERLAVVGGGNTAMDVARSLLRIGRKPMVVYRRTRAEMPAIPAEVDEAMVEGIPFHFLTAPVGVVAEGDRVVGLDCARMQLGEPDASGRRRPVPVARSEHRLPCDGVVTAIGEGTDLDFLPDSLRDGWKIAVDGRFSAQDPKIFAAGDAVDGAGTVTAAVGAGRRAAAMVDRCLRGEALPDAAPRVVEFLSRELRRDQVVYFEHLNHAYLRNAPRPHLYELLPESRVRTFDEVVLPFSEDDAVTEARRCFECGTCNECLNCYYFCPDYAIRKRAEAFGFDIDMDHCKGCGVCVEECPRSAMKLEVVR